MFLSNLLSVAEQNNISIFVRPLCYQLIFWTFWWKPRDFMTHAVAKIRCIKICVFFCNNMYIS